MIRIFLIEDDAGIRKELRTLLEHAGYCCGECKDFERVVEQAVSAEAQLILLDVNLPYFDGFHVCRELRKQTDVPIIIVTSRDSDADELMSMYLGADDFVTKPYNTQILLARIEALLKRAYKQDTPSVLQHAGLTLDLDQGMAMYDGNNIELTKNELRILTKLMRSADKIVSRDDLIADLWQTDEFIDDNTLTVNVTRLRGKLAEIGLTDYIVTRRGQGYLV